MAKKLYSAEEIEKRVDSLPREVRSLLYSFEMTSIVTKVGEKHGLHLDQMDVLNTEAAQVMLGLTQTSEFPEILMEDLGIDQAKADAVAKDIDATLFTRVRAALSQPSAMINTSPTPTPQQVPATPTAPKAAPTPAPAPTPATPTVPAIPKVDMHPADLMLTQKTVATPPAASSAAPTTTSVPAPKPATGAAVPPKPQEYKADPYREPVN